MDMDAVINLFAVLGYAFITIFLLMLCFIALVVVDVVVGGSKKRDDDNDVY